VTRGLEGRPDEFVSLQLSLLSESDNLLRSHFEGGLKHEKLDFSSSLNAYITSEFADIVIQFFFAWFVHLTLILTAYG
jgi:hypothetical protein